MQAFRDSYTFEAKGDYTSAAKEIMGIYKEDSYEINLRMGWLKYMCGMFTESITYYEKAIKLKPMSEEARLGIVYPASSLGNWDQVLLHYNKILEQSPNQTTVLYRMGLIYYNKGDFSRALGYYEKLVNLYPFSYDGLLMYAWTCFKLGKLNEAKVLFNKVLLLAPDDSSAAEGLSLIK
jgi:tetratricopeptide (TPR) repeat protein